MGENRYTRRAMIHDRQLPGRHHQPDSYEGVFSWRNIGPPRTPTQRTPSSARSRSSDSGAAHQHLGGQLDRSLTAYSASSAKFSHSAQAKPGGGGGGAGRPSAPARASEEADEPRRHERGQRRLRNGALQLESVVQDDVCGLGLGKGPQSKENSPYP